MEQIRQPRIRVNIRHIAVADWSKRPTCFRLVGSFVGSNLGRGSIIS